MSAKLRPAAEVAMAVGLAYAREDDEQATKLLEEHIAEVREAAIAAAVGDCRCATCAPIADRIRALAGGPDGR